MKSRTRARCLALQALYEVDIANHSPADVLNERLEESPLSDDLAEFARQIIFCVLPLTHDLDQIMPIDRNLLRVACWEFAVQGETPVKVPINDAVELAKLYGPDSAPRFVN